MKTLLTNLSIAKKIWLIVSLAMVSLAGLAGYTLLDKYSTLEGEKRLATQHVVESAYGVLVHFQALQIDARTGAGPSDGRGQGAALRRKGILLD